MEVAGTDRPLVQADADRGGTSRLDVAVETGSRVDRTALAGDGLRRTRTGMRRSVRCVRPESNAGLSSSTGRWVRPMG